MIQKTMTNDIGFIATQTINRRHISSRSKKWHYYNICNVEKYQEQVSNIRSWVDIVSKKYIVFD